MSDIKDWSTTAAGNNSAAPNGFPEGMAPSGVNNSAREVMAAVRTQHEDSAWVDFGHTVTYASATTFTIAGDYTTLYTANRRIRCTDSSTLYGNITSSTYSAPDTTVTVVLDSGVLSGSLTAAAVGVVDDNASVTGFTVGDTRVNNIMELVWPVGSVYESSAATDPATLFGVGTWTAITDVMRMAAGSTYTAGATGGSADAIVVAHTHTGPSHTHTGPSHTHTGTTANDTHNHRITLQTDSSGAANETVGGITGTAGFSDTDIQNDTHNHTFTTAASGTAATGASGTGATGSTGSSATGANLPPYKVYYAWERTA